MKSRLVWEQAGERTFVVVLDAGDEAFAAITDFANKNDLGGASLSAIGAFERATVGWFDLRSKTYKPIEIDEQCEGLTLLGDIAIGDDGKASLHMHAVLGLSDGTTRGGHFLKRHRAADPRSDDRRDAGASAAPQAGRTGHRADPALISGTSAANGPLIGHVIPARGDHDAKSEEDGCDRALEADHRKVEDLFEQFEKAHEEGRKEKLVKQICTELTIHTMIEEEIFYPACAAQVKDEDLLDESYVEHDGAKVLIAELIKSDPDNEFYDAKVNVLSEMIKHHVKEEEKRGEGMFAEAKKAGLDMEALGERLMQRKQELMAEFGEGDNLPAPETRSFTGHELQQGKPIEAVRLPTDPALLKFAPNSRAHFGQRERACEERPQVE